MDYVHDLPALMKRSNPVLAFCKFRKVPLAERNAVYAAVEEYRCTGKITCIANTKLCIDVLQLCREMAHVYRWNLRWRCDVVSLVKRVEDSSQVKFAGQWINPPYVTFVTKATLMEARNLASSYATQQRHIDTIREATDAGFEQLSAVTAVLVVFLGDTQMSVSAPNAVINGRQFTTRAAILFACSGYGGTEVHCYHNGRYIPLNAFQAN